MEEFHRQHPEKASVFDFRKYLAGVSQEELKKAAKFLYQLSVTHMSGPGNYHDLYQQLFPKGVEVAHAEISMHDGHWNPYLDLFRKSSITFYDPIIDRIRITNSASLQISTQAKVGVLADQSWTAEGAELKKKREAAMSPAALTLQGFFRWKTTPYQVLLRKGNKIFKDKPDYLILLRKGQYSLLLKKVCNDLNLPGVIVLLKYKDRINIQINEASSDGSTALDLAQKAKGNTQIQKKIIELLKAAGAQLGQEESKLALPTVKQ